jgi:putative intracellular protease/amidase/YHS domain-containing protein
MIAAWYRFAAARWGHAAAAACLLALACGGKARGDDHGHAGHAAAAGVASIDVAANGPRIHLLVSSKPGGAGTELHYFRSDDGGATWGDPVRVGEGLPAPNRARRGSDVQIAAAGDRIVAAWQSEGTGSFGGGPMVTATSADGGDTWKAGPNPADDGSTGGHGFIDVAADAAGTFHLVWLDSRDGAQGLRYARSTDGGASWSRNQTLDDETCECCWNAVATGPGGTVAVLYRDKAPRDMAMVRSADGGETWTRTGLVGEFDWDIEGCPHVGGGLAVVPGDGPPTIHSVVWTGRAGRDGVYYLGSKDGGRTLGEATRLGDSQAWHPDLAATDSGRVAAVWDARGEETRGIYGAVSEDGGKGWSRPRRLNGAGTTVSHPRVVATPTGFRAFWTERAEGKETTWASRELAATRADDAEASRVVLKGLDPVTLLEGQEVAGVEEFAASRGPFRYLFANAEHKARFEENPRRFAVQAETCAVMPKVPASPDLFLVHDGKIFLFGTPGCLARFRADPAAFQKPMRKVAVLVYDGMELLDFAGPGEVFAAAGQGRAFDVFTVAPAAGPVTSQGFVAITPRYTLADCPKPDILVIPGGSTRRIAEDPAVIAWIRETASDAEVVLSVCTGSLLLAKAGVLDGLEATTHRGSLDALRRAATKTKVVEGRRFVDNGKVITSAGVSAGIDASLHVVGRLLGADAASETAEYMEYRREPADPVHDRSIGK